MGLEHNRPDTQWDWTQWACYTMGLDTVDLIHNGTGHNGPATQWDWTQWAYTQWDWAQ